jgi:signal transduction histidine kinase
LADEVNFAKRLFKGMLDDLLVVNPEFHNSHDVLVWRPKFVQDILETVYTSIEERNLGMAIGDGLVGSVAKARLPSAGRIDEGIAVQHPKIVAKYGWQYHYVQPVICLETLVGVYAIYSIHEINSANPFLGQLHRIMEAGLLLIDNIVNTGVKDQSLEKSLLALEIGKAAEDRFHDIKESLFMANGALAALRKTRLEISHFNKNYEILTNQLEKSRDLSEKYIQEAKNPNTLTRTKFDIRKLVRASVRDLDLRSKQRAAHRQRKIDIRTNMPESAIFINGDFERIHRAIENILNNAEHWVIRSIGEVVRIDVELTEDTDFCYLKIFDTGPGIVEPRRALEKGYSLRGGTGLGLSIAKKIFELHDGSIQVNSNPPNWTSIELALPKATKD